MDSANVVPDVVSDPAMGFNKRKMGNQRRAVAEKEAAGRRATEKQIFESAVASSLRGTNERQAARMPMIYLVAPSLAVKV